MKRFAISQLILVLLSGCASNSDVEQNRIEIQQVSQQASQRLSQIEAKLSNDRLLDMVNQLEEMKSQIAKLSGETDVINYNLLNTQKRQMDLYTDLDTRLAKLETDTASAPVSAMAPAGSGDASAPATAQPAMRDYQQGLTLLRQRNFKASIPVLEQFIQQNPSSPQVVDATFWLGVAHTALKQYDTAIQIHRTFVQDFPNNPKAPDALRNIASCQLELSQQDQAKVTLKHLIRVYPNSDAANKARQILKTL